MNKIHLLAGIPLALAVLAPGAAVLADPPPDQSPAPAGFLPELPDSAALSTPTVAEGVVEDAAGRPVAGTPVVLLAWPSDAAMSAMVPGDTFNLVPVGKATTDAGGRYRLRVRSATDLAPMADPAGGVDLQVVAYTSEGPAVFSFPRRVVGKGNTSRLETIGGADPVGKRSTNPARADLRVAAGARAVTDDAVAVAEDAPVDKFCSSSLVQDYGPIWDLVGQMYIATTGVSGTFTYSSGAESELGVGFSSSGSFGSFSASGTSKKSATGSVTFPTLTGTGYKYYDTQFRWGKYRVTCVDPMSGWPTIWYEARVSNWVGGSRLRTLASAPSATYCTSFAAGSTFEKTTSSAITWSNGAATKGIIGIDLSTKTGYTTTAKLKYVFSSTRKLCGTHGDPGATPRQLVAKA